MNFYQKIYHIAAIFYLLINSNIITNNIRFVYKLSNFAHILSVVSQASVSCSNRTHEPYANSLAHYPLNYPGTQCGNTNQKITVIFKYRELHMYDFRIYWYTVVSFWPKTKR